MDTRLRQSWGFRACTVGLTTEIVAQNTLSAAHAPRLVDPHQTELFGGSTGIHTPHGILCLPHYQNTIGEREPSIWAGPLEFNFHRYGGWCPASYGILVGAGIYHIGGRPIENGRIHRPPTYGKCLPPLGGPQGEAPSYMKNGSGSTAERQCPSHACSSPLASPPARSAAAYCRGTEIHRLPPGRVRLRPPAAAQPAPAPHRPPRPPPRSAPPRAAAPPAPYHAAPAPPAPRRRTQSRRSSVMTCATCPYRIAVRVAGLQQCAGLPTAGHFARASAYIGMRAARSNHGPDTDRKVLSWRRNGSGSTTERQCPSHRSLAVRLKLSRPILI